MQLLQQSGSSNGSRKSARPALATAAAAYATATVARAARPARRPSGAASARWTSRANTNGAASMPRLRANAAPSSQPIQSGPNQTMLISSASGPSEAPDRSCQARIPAASRASPAARSSAEAKPDEAAYVVSSGPDRGSTVATASACASAAAHSAPKTRRAGRWVIPIGATG